MRFMRVMHMTHVNDMQHARRVHMCAMTHSYVCHDSFMGMTWHIPACVRDYVNGTRVCACMRVCVCVCLCVCVFVFAMAIA